jgi:hypothetical protein
MDKATPALLRAPVPAEPYWHCVCELKPILAHLAEFPSFLTNVFNIPRISATRVGAISTQSFPVWFAMSRVARIMRRRSRW